MAKKKFEVIRISNVAMGVGFIEKKAVGEYSESICETLYDTGIENDERDAVNSEKWAILISKALNEYFDKYDLWSK